MELDLTKLKEMRLDHGWSQMHCAANCNVSMNAWIAWERGLNKPNKENLLKIKKLFGIK